MSKLNLTFDPGAPIDATKLMQLVNAITELENTSLTLGSSLSSLQNAANATKRIIAGTTDKAKYTISGNAIPVEVKFNGTLSTAPAAVIVTLETSATNADLSYYIKSDSSSTSGFTLMLSRVAGVNSSNKVVTTSATYDNVRIHYIAIAKLEI